MVTRYFALRTSRDGRESSVFTGRQPRQAALKAASRGNTEIFLRERGTKKLHHFRGSRIRVRAPPNKPRWMAAQVWKPNVRKIGVVHMARPKKVKARRAKKAGRAKKTARRKTSRRAARRPARRAKKTKAKKRRRW